MHRLIGLLIVFKHVNVQLNLFGTMTGAMSMAYGMHLHITSADSMTMRLTLALAKLTLT